ncbi:hypothetical protein HYU96_03685 [Candidatus Daviesbacteria bacterium]|nr:hypothetical protein [Candidatus Daviesbacteria bacterium]
MRQTVENVDAFAIGLSFILDNVPSSTVLKRMAQHGIRLIRTIGEETWEIWVANHEVGYRLGYSPRRRTIIMRGRDLELGLTTDWAMRKAIGIRQQLADGPPFMCGLEGLELNLV